MLLYLYKRADVRESRPPRTGFYQAAQQGSPVRLILSCKEGPCSSRCNEKLDDGLRALSGSCQAGPSVQPIDRVKERSQRRDDMKGEQRPHVCF